MADDNAIPDRSRTVKHASRVIGVSDRQVWRYIQEGKLRAERYSARVIRIRDSEIERFRNACAYGCES
jgi:excisionase family DNA binding protein